MRINKQSKTGKQIDYLYEKVKNSLIQNEQKQLFYKAFLKPIEIYLNNQKQQNQENSHQKSSFGLKQVIKQNISDNKFVLQDFNRIDVSKLLKNNGNQIKNLVEISFQQIQQMNCDNMISLFKPPKQSFGFKLAICIFINNQKKQQLKQTLNGVIRNIQILQKQGINDNKIGIFLMINGIQSVDSSIIEYIEELQKQHNIQFRNQMTKDPKQKLQIIHNDQIDEEEEENVNFNYLIFPSGQFQQMKSRSFLQRKKEYSNCKKLMSQLQNLQKQKFVAYQNLDKIVQKFFIEQARKQYQNYYGAGYDEANYLKQDVLIQIYGSNRKASIPIFQRSINQAKKYCSQYIQTRRNLALMHSFRISANKSYNKNEGLSRMDQYVQINSPAKTNLFIVTKYESERKSSNSLYGWFLNGFCQQLNPEYVVFLKGGQIPAPQAFWKMCNHMDQNERVGCVFGFKKLKISKLDQLKQQNDEQNVFLSSILTKAFDIKRSQQFSYNLSNIINKPFQSILNFKYIHDNQQIFCAYRAQVIKKSKISSQYLCQNQSITLELIKQNPNSVLQILTKVFLPSFIYNCFYTKQSNITSQGLLQTKNAILSQDKLITLDLFNTGYQIAYMPDVYILSRPINKLTNFINQTKKLSNGNFYSFQIMKELSTCCQSFFFNFEMFYIYLVNLFSFFTPALFMYLFHVSMLTFQINVIFAPNQNSSSFSDPNYNWNNNIFVYITDFIYFILFFGLIFNSICLSNYSTQLNRYLNLVSSIYGIFSMSIFGVMLYDIITGLTSQKDTFLISNLNFTSNITGGQIMISSLRYLLIGIFTSSIVPILLFIIFGHCNHIIDLVLSFLSYIFYIPTNICLIPIYSICKLDHLSFSYNINNTNKIQKNIIIYDQWRKAKMLEVCKFLFCNIIACFLLLFFGNQYQVRFWIIYVIVVVVALNLTIKILLSIFYLLKYRLCNVTQTIKNIQTQPTNIRQKDQISQIFQKIKQSFYKKIREEIIDIVQNIVQDQNDFDYKSIVQSSKLYLETTNKYRRKNNYASFSKIHQKNLSKVYKNSIEPIKKPQQKKGIKLTNKQNKVSQMNQSLMKLTD